MEKGKKEAIEEAKHLQKFKTFKEYTLEEMIDSEEKIQRYHLQINHCHTFATPEQEKIYFERVINEVEENEKKSYLQP